MILLHLQHLFSNTQPQLVHAVIPLQRELLELFTIVELDLLCLLLMFLDQAVLDASLGMLPHDLDVLQLRIGVDILALARMIQPLLVQLVDQVADIVDELFLLDDGLVAIARIKASHLLL